MLLKPEYVVTVVLVLITSVATQTPQSPVQTAGAPTVDVRRDWGSGKYIIRYRVGNEDREHVFIPSTLISAKIRTDVTFDPQRNVFVYRYRVANTEGAVQQLHQVSIPAIRMSSIVETPSGWEPLATAQVGRIAWYMKPVGGVKVGVAPGSFQDGFVLESTNLPGASQARCTGNAPFPSVAADTPDEVKSRIMELVRTDFSVVDVLSPTIPAGLNEPELNPASFVARIQGAYGWPLTRSKHRHASEINQHLARAVSVFQSDKPDRAVADVKAIYPLLHAAGEDEWSGNLGDGLGLALDYAGRRYRW